MSVPASHAAFVGHVPDVYERFLVPLLFVPYATDMAARVAQLGPTRVLELAAGTGILTRHMAATLPANVAIVATDLNPPMLQQAAAVGTSRPVEWRQADAMRLPFDASSFDVVVCQFGVMFFPDKAHAFGEARRVLKPGGHFLFSVWDGLEANEFAYEASTSLEVPFSPDPPQYLARTPYAYNDVGAIRQALRDGGFVAEPTVTTITERSRAESPRAAAMGFLFGTPMRTEIEAHGAERFDEALDIAAAAIAERFGTGEVDAKMQALVVSVPAP